MFFTLPRFSDPQGSSFLINKYLRVKNVSNGVCVNEVGIVMGIVVCGGCYGFRV